VDYRESSAATFDAASVPRAGSPERSIGEILKDIAAGVQDIVRFEIKLAKIELADTARRLRSSSALLAGAAVLGFFAIGFVLLAALFALEIALPAWLAALILGALLAAGAWIGMAAGWERLKKIQAPHKTMQTVREDLQWMKEQARS